MLKSLLSLYHKLLQVMKNKPTNTPTPIIPKSEDEWQDGLKDFNLMFVLFESRIVLMCPTDIDIDIENEDTTHVLIYPSDACIPTEVKVGTYEDERISFIQNYTDIQFILDKMLDSFKELRAYQTYEFDMFYKKIEAERIRQEQQDEADYEDGKLISVRDETTGDYSYQVNPRYRF